MRLCRPNWHELGYKTLDMADIVENSRFFVAAHKWSDMHVHHQPNQLYRRGLTLFAPEGPPCDPALLVSCVPP